MSLKKMFAVVLVAVFGFGHAFEKASMNYRLQFPRDHGAHPEYKTEWWYFTGNVKDSTGRSFGYQLTFFRNSLEPASKRKKRSSAWASSDFYMAHAAVSDVGAKKHSSQEKIVRGAKGLAGAETEPSRVYLENWKMEGDLDGQSRLTAATPSFELRLNLRNRKPLVMHGKNGFSQKGFSEGNASMYYSYTRLQTDGEIVIEGKKYFVSGWSWMDHEFSTSVLEKDQVGWDWFSIQMQDHTELMLFRLRNQDKKEGYGNATFVGADGKSVSLSGKEFSIQESGAWTSGRTKATYPSRWMIEIPKLGLKLEVAPKFADQEMKTSVAYWEGAVDVSAVKQGQNIKGEGYVELTGYAGSMQGVL